MFTRILLAISLMTGLHAASLGAENQPLPQENLIKNGDFSQGKDWPDDWPKGDRLSWETDADGVRHLRITADPGKFVNIYKWLRVENYAGQALELSVTARTQVERGSDNWHTPRIIMHFKNHAFPWEGKNVNPSPGALAFPTSTDGEWVTRTSRFHIPKDAKTMEFMPSLPHVKSGTFDLREVSLRAIPAAVLHAPPTPAESPEAQAAEARDMFRAPLPPMLRVTGNQVHDDKGNAVWLQGLNVPSLEWNPGGERVLQSIEVAIKDWNAKIIRLPVKDTFWFGRGTGWTAKKDGGKSYRALVDQCIRLAADHGVYTVLDLHVYRAPVAEHLQFWEYAARRYKDHPAVLFGIMNEPHGTSWEIWRNGGPVEMSGVNVPTYGQQGLVDTVRKTGARNIIVAGGLDWAYDLSGIANGFALDDRAGHGIIYDTHIYNWKRDWAGKVLIIADRHPLLVGEWGAQPKGKEFDFVPKEAQEDPATWIPDMIGLIQKYRLHHTAWCFHHSSAPALLKSKDSFEPTEHFGQPVKDMLHGKNVPLQRKR